MNWTSFILACVGAFIGLVLMYIESKLFNIKRTNFTYIKNMILCGFISYIVKELLPSSLILDIMSNTEYIQDIGETIYNKKANF